MKNIIHSDNAPAAIGPYSQAVEANGMIFISGQLPIDPATGTMPEGITAQTEQSMKNLEAILTAAGCTFDNVVKSTCLLADMSLEHRIGGLEKSDVYGDVSHDPMNHQVMTNYRAEKVQRIANYIPEQEIIGSQNGGELLVIGWGGTFGALNMAVKELREEGYDVSLAQFNYIFPLPKNTEDVLKKFKKRVVCELNLGQFADYLRTQYPQYPYEQFNKVQGLPFFISELKEKFKQLLAK